MDRPMVTHPRWIATVHYRSESGLIDLTHDLEELEELQDLIEAGPHFDTISKIEITYGLGAEDGLTLEQVDGK